MTTTVDRITSDALPLREIDGSIIDPERTGYGLFSLRDMSISAATDDEPKPLVLMAGQQFIGSFPPAVVESPEHGLEEFVTFAFLASSASGLDINGDIVVMPPLSVQKATLRIRGVFDALPSSLAFEE